MAIEDEEYESNPEDAIVPMRRREASDDEEEGERSDRGRDRTAEIGSDAESDGQGAAPAYEEGEHEEEIDEEDEIVEEEEEEEEGIEGEEVEEEEQKGLEGSRREEEEEEEGEEKKENEPYAMPTAGAFYMHDDRFQENGRRRNRRIPGGRRIWESKDDHAWLHDRFEEMNVQDTRYNQGRRNSRGRFRGCGGRTRGAGRGFVKGNRYRGNYDDDNNQNHDGSNKNRDGKNQNCEPRPVRGTGPRCYEPPPRNEVPASQFKQPAKSHESTSIASTRRSSAQTPNVQPYSGLPKKPAFGSNLNSASPPFYPFGKQVESVTQKRDLQAGNTNKIVSSSMQMKNNILTSETRSMLRGKAVVDSVSHDRLYIDDSLHSFSGNAFANAQMQSSVSLLASVNTTHSSQSMVQGRSSSTSSQTNYQPIASLGQVTRVTAQIQPAVHQRSQAQMQPALRVSTRQMGQQRPVSGNQIASPPHVSSTNSSEVIKTDAPPGSSKCKNQLVAKGKTGIQGSGRGSLLYNGAQVIGASGAMGLSHSDQNFSATPAFLPVMQFGGQHHGGLGVPAVGMALPGYVAQPQLGFGNSEMTWVPVLAGAAGALGASYSYIGLDGNCYPRPPGQTSSAVASSESSASKSVNGLKPPQRSEIVNDEFGQCQNKPRRYSEMNFGQ